jgi:hypothetical protein
MSNDFDDDDAFFSSGDDPAKADLPLGLVVPPRARLIFDDKGGILYDENAENELAFRRRGMPRVQFFEADDAERPATGFVG